MKKISKTKRKIICYSIYTILVLLIILSIIYIVNYFLSKKQAIQESQLLEKIEIYENQVKESNETIEEDDRTTQENIEETTNQETERILKEFYQEHPIIRFTTNKEDAEYEIISAFKSKVYYKTEKNVFRYYFFVNVKTEAEYNEFVQNAKKASLYDIDKTAEFGDQLITLSTCSYHIEDGRFAVVGRKAFWLYNNKSLVLL